MEYVVRVGALAVAGVVAACGSVNDHAADAGLPADAVAIDAAVAEQSCAGLAATCGPSKDESCCTSLAVPSGMFARTYMVNADGNITGLGAQATLGDYRLDKYEVTVGRFRAFVASGKGLAANGPADGAGRHERIMGSGWSAAWNPSLPGSADTQHAGLVSCDLSTWTDTAGGNETRPINCVTWYDAMAFCIWDGGYLATEAEWEQASAGGDQQRVLPWSVPSGSTVVDASYASYSPDDGKSMCTGDGQPACTLTDLLAVGSDAKGNGRWGHADLGGNVNEWVLDWYVTPYSTPCTDCATVSGGTARAVRGGSFNDDALSMYATARFSRDPTKREANLGFRCARTP